MNSRTLAGLVKYGVASDLANKAHSAGLTVTKARALNQTDIVQKYGLSTLEAKTLTKCVQRKAVDKLVLQVLLERSNFTCCVCKGHKSHAFIVHHITEYEKTQDNAYDNLVVICPADHDLAHKSGLASGITGTQLRRAKAHWEQDVEAANAKRAAQIIAVVDDAIDYVNVKRIEELCVRLFQEIPITTLTASLKHARILGKNGAFDQKYVKSNLSNGRYLFDYSTHQETEHYKQLMQEIAKVTEFVDLDAAATLGGEALKATEGQYAFFVGGVCAKRPKLPITDNTPAILLHYSRKNLKIEWILDPIFMMSMSAIVRIGGKNRYIIYCLVRTVDESSGNTILVKASPLLVAQPTKFVDKTPAIASKRSMVEI